MRDCATCGVTVATSASELVEKLAGGHALGLTTAAREPAPYGVASRVFCTREHLIAWLQHPASAPAHRQPPDAPVRSRDRSHLRPVR